MTISTPGYSVYIHIVRARTRLMSGMRRRSLLKASIPMK
jgi:hypothetical protein